MQNKSVRNWSPISELRCRANVPLLGIACIAFLVRFVGIGFGTPLVSNFYVRPDESLVVVRGIEQAMGLPSDFVLYPSLFPKLLSLLFQANVANAFSWQDTAGLAIDLARSATPFFLISRLVSVMAGTLTVFTVYQLAVASGGRSTGYLAASLFAIAPLPVRDAHFGVTDTLMIFFASNVLLQCQLYLQKDGAARMQALVLGCLFFALAVSTKYSAALFAAPMVAAVVMRPGPRSLGKIFQDCGIGLLIVASSFGLLNPEILWTLPSLYRDLGELSSIFYSGTDSAADWSAFRVVTQLMEPMFFGPGGVFGLLLLATSAGLRMWRRTPLRAESRLLLVAFLAIVLPLLPFRHGIPYRYLLPAMPILAVAVSRQFSGSGRLGGWQRTGVLVLLLAPGLWTSLQIDRRLMTEDTRSVCGRWIVENVATDTPLLIFGGPECEPQIPESKRSLERRIAYVHRIYGDRGGGITATPYRWIIKSSTAENRSGGLVDHGPSTREEEQGSYDVFRQPEAAPSARGTHVALVPTYVLRTAGFDPSVFQTLYNRSRVVRHEYFGGIDTSHDGFLIDEIDGFFLPMTGWHHVTRPGPNLEVFVLEYEPQDGGRASGDIGELKPSR